MAGNKFKVFIDSRAILVPHGCRRLVVTPVQDRPRTKEQGGSVTRLLGWSSTQSGDSGQGARRLL